MKTSQRSKPRSAGASRPKTSSAARSAGSPQAAGGEPSSRRNVTVFISLVVALTFTSALLLALAPAPLTPGASSSLFAVETPQSLDVIFETARPVTPGRWTHIYVHHSLSADGNATTLGTATAGLADHFLIGNGEGCVDGELQLGQRWNNQEPAGKNPGIQEIEPGCISICLVGDFNQARPTPTQMRRLGQLVNTLQSRLHIPSERVTLVDDDADGAGPGGVGRHFPAAAFRAQLLP